MYDVCDKYWCARAHANVLFQVSCLNFFVTTYENRHNIDVAREVKKILLLIKCHYNYLYAYKRFRTYVHQFWTLRFGRCFFDSRSVLATTQDTERPHEIGSRRDLDAFLVVVVVVFSLPHLVHSSSRRLIVMVVVVRMQWAMDILLFRHTASA